jgi:cystathionine beta-lyase/cystathionine gamma-synthase
MDRPPRSPETLAAQALGDVDAGSGGLAPVINLSTTYEQLPDGSHHQDRSYTRADNPTYEVAEQLLAALEGAREPPVAQPPQKQLRIRAQGQIVPFRHGRRWRG